LFSDDEEVLAGAEGAGVAAGFAPSLFAVDCESPDPVEAAAEFAGGALLLLL
jgi:hypothetical protein